MIIFLYLTVVNDSLIFKIISDKYVKKDKNTQNIITINRNNPYFIMRNQTNSTIKWTDDFKGKKICAKIILPFINSIKEMIISNQTKFGLSAKAKVYNLKKTLKVELKKIR